MKKKNLILFPPLSLSPFHLSRIQHFASVYSMNMQSSWRKRNPIMLRFSQGSCFQFSYLHWYTTVLVTQVRQAETRKRLSSWQHRLLSYQFWVSFLNLYLQNHCSIYFACRCVHNILLVSNDLHYINSSKCIKFPVRQSTLG